MKKQQNTTVFLFALAILGLFVPITQQLFHFMSIKGLVGSVNQDTTQLSYSWWNGDLQKRIENESTDSMSILPACVRLRNQFEFSVFDKINATDIYEFDGVFYRYTYPAFNLGHEFVGKDKIKTQIESLLKFQESKEGLPIYVIITPSKLRVFEDNLPQLNRANTELTNYNYYASALKNSGIQLLDVDAWWRKNRSDFNAPIMSKLGVHWTLYGASMAMDSFVKRINVDLHSDYQPVQMEVTSAYELYESDVDLMNLSNLMWKKEDRTLRNVYFPEPMKTKKKMRPFVISDSFFHAISWTDLFPQIFQPNTPYYYYFQSRVEPNGSSKPINYAVLDSDLKQSDCILIITDIQNLTQFGFGFIEKYIQQKQGF